MLITFEGGEGAGKSTLINRLGRALRETGKSVVVTREPGGCPLAERVRELVLTAPALVPKAELMLFLAARAQHMEELILPALTQGAIVLCDRFQDSTIAYQGGARSLGIEAVKQWCQWVTPVEPIATFYLDISPEVGLARATEKSNMEEEGVRFHERVRHYFLQLAQESYGRIRLIDASQSQDAVFEQVWQQIKTLLSHL